MKWSHSLSIIIITAFSIILYTGTLNNGFVYDDESTIVNNVLIRDLGNLPKLFTKEYFTQSGEISYRPVVTFSYFIDYWLYADDARGFHLTNFLLHTFNALLVYLFLLLLFQEVLAKVSSPSVFIGDSGFKVIENNWIPAQRLCGKDKNIIPLIVTLLFASHPILTEAVNAISFREDLLASFFYILTLIIYLRLRERGCKTLFYLLSCLTYTLALFSKEMALTLPLIVLCYETICKGREKVTLVYGYILITLFYCLLRFYFFYNPEESVIGWDLNERMLTLPLVIINFIKLAVFPVSLSAEYMINPVKSVHLPLFTALSGIAIFITLLATKQKNNLSFGISFFLITLIPVYNIIPISNPLADRYLYLPTVGFIIALGTLIFRGRSLRSTKINPFFILIPFSLILFYSSLTLNRNRVWSDEYSLWSDIVRKMPGSWRAYNGLGRAYAHQNRLTEAKREYNKALTLKPDYFDGHVNLGIVYVVEGNLEKGLHQFKTALALNPNNSDLHNNIAYIYRKQGRTDDAIQEYRTVLRLNPDHIKGHYNLGLVYISKGLIDKARIEFETALKIKPDFLPARQALESTGRQLEKINE